MSRLLVGVVGAPHGVKGEVRVKSYTGTPSAIAGYGALHAQGREQPLTVRAHRLLKDDMLVVRFAGIDDRTHAEALRGAQLFIDRGALPPTDDDEYYLADLIGLRTQTAGGQPVGRVRTLLNHGAGDILEIERDDGDTLLVAFTRAFVPVVDVSGGFVVVTDEALDDEPGEAP